MITANDARELSKPLTPDENSYLSKIESDIRASAAKHNDCITVPKLSNRLKIELRKWGYFVDEKFDQREGDSWVLISWKE